MSRRKQHRRRILSEDHLNVGARAGGARITYWSGEGPDLANVRPIGDNDLRPLVDFVKDEVIRKLAEAWDVNDEDGEIWSVDIEGDTGSLDRRVMIAAPLVCHLIGHPKRHFDPDSTIAATLLIAVPPVRGALIVAERIMDGLYWPRRKFD
jgi:hypothetical protein